MAGGVRYIPEEFGKPKEWCHPHHRIPTDLEPAFVIGKDESCCPPTGDPCECVTSGDIAKWNFVYDNFSALADIDVSAINDFVDDVSALNSSADYWNSTFETVSSNSANWNIVDELKLSAKDHEERISDLEDFADDTEDRLSAIDNRLENLHFDNDITDPNHSISGDGSNGAPFGVNNYDALKTTNDNYEELNSHIIKFSADGVKNILYEFDGAAYNVARIDGRLNGIDKTNEIQNTNIQRNYELITEIANRQKGKQDKLKFGYNNSGYIISINNSAIAGGTGGGLTGDAQGALDQVYANSAVWLTAHQDLSDYATTAELETNVNLILDEVATKLDATAFKPEEFYPMEGNPSGFLVEDDLSGYATKELLEDVANELVDEIDTKQRILSAGDYIDIVSGEDADIISVTGLDTNTYFNATYGQRVSTDYFTFDGTKLSANSDIGYFSLTINYKVNTNNTIEDNYYSAGININDIEVDKHYIDGNIPSETYTFSKNVLNDAENNLYEIIKNVEPGVSINDLNITCIGFIGEADAVNVGILGINGNILTFGNTILRV